MFTATRSTHIRVSAAVHQFAAAFSGQISDYLALSVSVAGLSRLGRRFRFQLGAVTGGNMHGQPTQLPPSNILPA
jgi:hypothetical protein